MDSDAVSTADPAVRPRTQRERHLPAHLEDYEVQLPAHLHSAPPPADTSSQRHSRHSSQCISSGTASKATSRSRHSAPNRSPRHALSEVQAAVLEEKLKALELEELQRQIEEDATADKECQRLDDQAREALKAREALAKQIDIRRRLKKAQNELEVAKLVTSFLKQDSNSRSGSQSSIPSNLSEAQPGVNRPPQRAVTSDIFTSYAQEMHRSSLPQPAFLTSEASVLLPPATQVVQFTSSAQDFTTKGVPS